MSHQDYTFTDTSSNIKKIIDGVFTSIDSDRVSKIKYYSGTNTLIVSTTESEYLRLKDLAM